jgi:hypothetical protein
MAVRNPIYLTGSNQLQVMSNTHVDFLIEQAVYQYSQNPSVTLAVSHYNQGNNGYLKTMTDTRLRAGQWDTNVSAFPSEVTTEEPTTVSIPYERLTQTWASVSPTVDTGKIWPVYMTATNQIQAMSLQDVKDTILHPAIDLLVTGGTPTPNQGGTYTLTTSPTPAAGFSIANANVVFKDTRAWANGYNKAGTTIGTDGDVTRTLNGAVTAVANLALTTGSGTVANGSVVTGTGISGNTIVIDTNGTTYVLLDTVQTLSHGVTLTFNPDLQDIIDQGNTVNYFLHSKDGVDNSWFTVGEKPVYITGSDQLQEYNEAGFEGLLQEWMRETAAESGDGYKLVYKLDTTDSSTRTTLVNNYHTGGSGDYITYKVNTDDYRAQEFPDGTTTSSNIGRFRLIKE